MAGIGQLNEKPLHASLKTWYARPDDCCEVPVDGYVIDIVRDGVLLEIQTGSFAAIRTKLSDLVRTHQVRLVYPIAREKWIVTSAGNGVTRRKSPKRGRVEDVFWELVSVPGLLAHPNFSLDVVLIREEEVRAYRPKKRRRNGWGTEERRLLEVVDARSFEDADDLRELIPAAVGEQFTTQDLAEALRISRGLAQKMAYCLHKASAIAQVGMRGRSKLYSTANADGAQT